MGTRWRSTGVSGWRGGLVPAESEVVIVGPWLGGSFEGALNVPVGRGIIGYLARAVAKNVASTSTARWRGAALQGVMNAREIARCIVAGL